MLDYKSKVELLGEAEDYFFHDSKMLMRLKWERAAMLQSEFNPYE